MNKRNYHSQNWQENVLKSLYHAFSVSNEEGLKNFLNLIFEVFYENPPFLLKLYQLMDIIKEEGVCKISKQTLEWVEYWKTFDMTNKQGYQGQKEKLYALVATNWLSSANLGRLYFQLGYFEDKLDKQQAAVSLYEKSIQLYSTWPLGYYRLSVCLYNLANYDRALEMIDKALRFHFENPTYWKHKARCLKMLRVYNKALEAIERAILHDQENSELWWIKAIYLHDDFAKYQEAIEAIDKVLSLSPQKKAHIWQAKALCLFRLRKYKEALEQIEQAISIEANKAKLWAYKTVALYFLGRYKQAFEAIKNARKLDLENSLYSEAELIILSKIEEFEGGDYEKSDT